MIGGLLSSSFAGLFLAFTGVALGRVVGTTLAITVGIALFALWLILGSLGLVQRRRIGPSRQTNPVWRRRFGTTRAAFLWGVDLSTGFTTQSTYAGFWLLPLVVMLVANPAVGAISYLTFSLTRAMPIALSPILPGGGMEIAFRLTDPLRRVNVAVAVVALVGVTQSVLAA